MARCVMKDTLTDENYIRIEGWAKDGLTEKQIATNLNIAAKTLWEWKHKDSRLGNILKKGKDVADREVENALYKSALGYDVCEETIDERMVDGKMVIVARKQQTKHIQPNATSIIYWLNNRKPSEWRNKQETVNINVDKINENMQTLAEKINNPAPNRKIEDFE